ncbi:MAG: DUF4860 domain-containing protein [Clostridia bacterium]|nr:DUF4860 domain-containing protein [Clostridia bacterium]
MKRKTRPQGLFVLVLYLLFALCTMALMVTASSVYENITVSMEQNHSIRTNLSYISTKIRQADSIAITDGRIEAYEKGFVSRIYFYDDNICEQYCEADMEFDAEYGDAITQAESFETSADDKAYYINIGIDGAEYPLIFTKNK